MSPPFSFLSFHFTRQALIETHCFLQVQELEITTADRIHGWWAQKIKTLEGAFGIIPPSVHRWLFSPLNPLTFKVWLVLVTRYLSSRFRILYKRSLYNVDGMIREGWGSVVVGMEGGG